MRILAIILNITLLVFVSFSFSMMRFEAAEVDTMFIGIWSLLAIAPIVNLIVVFRTFKDKQIINALKAKQKEET